MPTLFFFTFSLLQCTLLNCTNDLAELCSSFFACFFFFRILVVFFSLHFVSFGDSENFLGLTSSFTSCFYFHMPRSFFSFLPCSIPSQSFVLCISSKHFCKWVRLNYATTHHHPPPPTTSQNISTNMPHHPPAAKMYPPPTTTIQNISK